MAPGHCQNKQNCVCECVWVWVCMRGACVSAHTHVGKCVAAKCHCVSAKTNRLNEKQLLGQGERK